MPVRTFARPLVAGLLAASPALAQTPQAPAPRPQTIRQLHVEMRLQAAPGFNFQAGAPAGPTAAQLPPLPGDKPPPPPVVGDIMKQTLDHMLGAMGGPVKPFAVPLPSTRPPATHPQCVPCDPLTRETVVQVELPATPRAACTPVPGSPTKFCADPEAVQVQIVEMARSVAAVRIEECGPAGTWQREFNGCAFTVTMRDGQLTVAAKTAKQTFTLTADYHVSRDGGSLVGLITGVDVSGDAATAESYAKLLKAMTDKPFALSFRACDGEMMLGNVRMPECDDADIAALFGAIGGKYAATAAPTAAKPEKPAKPTKPTPPADVKLVQYPADPHARVIQLLQLAEETSPARGEWRKLWVHEAPVHTPPEKIPGTVNK